MGRRSHPTMTGSDRLRQPVKNLQSRNSEEDAMSSVNRRGTRALLGLLAGVGVVSIAGVAQAATVQLSTGVLTVKESSDGPVKRGTGAGVLMPRLEPMSGNKLMAIWMDSAPDSNVPPPNGTDNNGRWEGKIAIIQLNPEAAPT